MKLTIYRTPLKAGEPNEGQIETEVKKICKYVSIPGDLELESPTSGHIVTVGCNWSSVSHRRFNTSIVLDTSTPITSDT